MYTDLNVEHVRPTWNTGYRDKSSEALHYNVGEKPIVILSTNCSEGLGVL